MKKIHSFYVKKLNLFSAKGLICKLTATVMVSKVFIFIVLLLYCSAVSGQSISDLEKRALDKVSRQDYEGALLLLNQALKIAPESVQILLKRAELRFHHKDFKGSVADYVLARVYGHESAYAYKMTGKAREKLKDYSGAVADYTRAVQLDVRNPLYYYCRALALRAMGNPAAALRDLSTCIKLRSRAEYYFDRGMTKIQLNYLDGAIKDFGKAIHRDRWMDIAHFQRGRVNARLGNYLEALRDYNRAIRLQKRKPDYFCDRGQIRVKLNKDYEGALTDFDKALKINPGHAEAFHQKAIVYLALNKMNLALANIGKALSIETSAVYYYTRGLIAEKLNKKLLALKDFKKSKDMEPSFLPAREAYERLLKQAPSSIRRRAEWENEKTEDRRPPSDTNGKADQLVVVAKDIYETGVGSYYSDELHGKHTKSGEPYDKNALTAAHQSLPMGTKVEITNRTNGKKVIVRINDHGPHIKNRIIDLSRAAAEQLNMIIAGIAVLEIRLVKQASVPELLFLRR